MKLYLLVFHFHYYLLNSRSKKEKEEFERITDASFIDVGEAPGAGGVQGE